MVDRAKVRRMIRKARSWIVHRFFGGESLIAIEEHGKPLSLREAGRRQRTIERQERERGARRPRRSRFIP